MCDETNLRLRQMTEKPSKRDQQPRDSEETRIQALLAAAAGHIQGGRLAEAEKACRDILALDPRHAASFDRLGWIAWKTGRFADAIRTFREAIALEPQNAGFYLNLGNALRDFGQIDDAIRAYETAIALNADLAAAYSELGLLYISQGRREDACRTYETAIALRPKRGSFYRLRAFVAPLARDSDVFHRMEALAASISELPDSDRMELHFALAKAYEDFGEHERSFAELLAGNALKRKRVPYQENEALRWLARVQQVFSPEFLAARHGFGVSSKLPICVVGMPRSGSTLVEQILASHPDIHGAGELPILQHLLRHSRTGFPEGVATLAPAQINRLAEQYLTILKADGTHASRIVDKFLDNFMLLGLISLMLPRAKIIHIRRDAWSTCLSCFASLFNGNHLPYSYDLGELGRFYRAYERLMAHWREVLPRSMMLEIQYEDLVRDFESQVRSILAHCGLPWDERCLAFHRTQRSVKTSSALQVRQPLYQTALDKWRVYEALAQPLRKALET